MRFEIIGQWKDGYEHDGLLYCAQRIEEMLMNYTSHLYKVRYCDKGSNFKF